LIFPTNLQILQSQNNKPGIQKKKKKKKSLKKIFLH
jgi:hypothetical protein